MSRIQLPKAPTLPLAESAYERRAKDELLRILRIYFNQLDNVLNTLFAQGGGQYLDLPNGSFSSRTSQTVATINTATLVTLNTTDNANGMVHLPGNGIQVLQDGVYRLLVRMQLTNTATQPQDMSIWLRKNNVDIPYTAGVVTVLGTHGGQPGYQLVSVNVSATLVAGDYVDFWWATNDVRVTLQALPPITTPFANPGAPSVSVAVTFVSARPS